MKTFPTMMLMFVPMALIADLALGQQPVPRTSAGPSLEGNAALVYWQAFAALPNLSAEQWNRQSKILMDPVAAPLDQQVEAMVQQAQVALEQLRRAAKLDRVDWALAPQTGLEIQLPHLSKALRLSDYAVLSARLKFSHGRASEGVADLIAALRLARHVSADPYFIVLSTGLGIEGNALRTAAAGLKDMDAAAMKDLQAGLETLPKGGTMAAVMAESRRRLVGLIKDMEAADPKDHLTLVEKHFGKLRRTELASGSTPTDNAPVEKHFRNLLARAKSLLALSDKFAEAMRIPDEKIDQFEQQRVKLTEEVDRHQVHPWPGGLLLCLDSVDRYLEGRVRVLQPMLQAAIAYRLGGKEAFEKVRDPYGSGPFELKTGPGQIEVVSKLRVGPTVIKQSFTVPATRRDGAK